MNRILRRYCDEVLYYHWDPIGVSDSPAARDEYDDYISAIVGLVMREASEAEIAAHLVEIERSRMRLTANEDRARRAARILVEWRDELADSTNGARLMDRCR